MTSYAEEVKGCNDADCYASIMVRTETMAMPVASDPGLPRKSDGSLLFLMHLVSHMPALEEGGPRIGIVLNGSPLFTGAAGSGESEIRRHLLENDLVEAIVALPTDMCFNTGISTYVWILSNKKEARRAGPIGAWLAPGSSPPGSCGSLPVAMPGRRGLKGFPFHPLTLKSSYVVYRHSRHFWST